MDEQDKDVIRLARTLIRDLAHGWPVRELAAPPENVCTELSRILGEGYDFESGIAEDE